MDRAAAHRAVVRIAVGAAIALLAVALTVGALTVVEGRSQRWVLHGREVSRLARTALELALEQEAELRGYLVSGDRAALAVDAPPHIGPTLDTLLAATTDNPVQHARARAVRAAIEEWDRRYRRPLLAAPPASGRRFAEEAASYQRGRALFDAVRERVAAFVAAEEALYEARVRRDGRVRWIVVVVVVAEVLLLLWLVRRIYRQSEARTAQTFDQQDRLTMQADDLTRQAATLEEQAVELEAQTEELASANQSLAEAVAEGMRALAATQASEARFRSVVQTATDAIITSGADGRIQFWNAAAEQVYGYTAAEAIGQPLAMLIPEARRAAHPAEYAEMLAGRAPILSAGPVLRDAQHREGHVFPVELAVSRWTADDGVHITSVVRDVSDRSALESRLAHQAAHDALTGLANRARFREHVTAALAREADRPERVAVLFLDLDDFKAINDTEGHAAGDQLLATIAERLLGATRGSDAVARLGGDEFAVLLRHVDSPAAAGEVADRILAALRRPIALGAREVRVGVSAGLAHGTPGADAEALLRHADTAMYAAKEERGGGYLWFAPAMYEALVERARVQADIVPGLERGEFWVAYQPIITLETGAVVGVEALVRWAHPQRGPLSPAAFIPVAEASGQIVPLGRWVLAEACRTVAPFPGDPYVTVNLSARQLGDPHLVRDVAHALEASGLAPERLVLEVTETVLMSDTEGTLERLLELKALGVRLAIDDFGTGYSALRYLQRFPVDVLKIDKSFVDRIDDDDHDAALVRTIVALGEMLGLTTVAEGIERVEQRDQLRTLGCPLGQGYHFARPLGAAAIADLLAAMETSTTGAGQDTIEAPSR